MMSGTQTSTAPGKTRGCRCAATPGECRCGTTAAECPVTTGYELARPIFFAGQLLAEADMDAVSTYLLTKFRLRNRYLFGAGVACGLIVTPATNTDVCVGAGYALDGCGNDVIVPTPQSVRVLDLVSDLRRGLRTVNACDTPLPEPKNTDGDYDLFVRGYEKPAAFDSPYELEDGCGSQCQPTRMLEAFAFELRYAVKCEQEAAPCEENPDLVAPLKKLRWAAVVLDAARLVMLRRQQIETAVKAQTADALKQAALDALAAVEKTGGSMTDRARREQYLSAALVALARIARYRFKLDADTATWAAFWKDKSPTFDGVRKLHHAGGRLDPAVARRWVELLNQSAFDTNEFDPQALFVGEPVTLAKIDEGVQAVHEAATGLRSLAVLQLVSFPDDVVSSLGALIQTNVDTTKPLKSEDMTALATGLRAAAEVVERGGLCQPLLPPCCPSNDPAVRIATITMKGGEVAAVCNLTRTVLHTPSNLLYWRLHHVVPFVPCDERRCIDLATATADGAKADAGRVYRWTSSDPNSLAQVLSTDIRPAHSPEGSGGAGPLEGASRVLEVCRRMVVADLENQWATKDAAGKRPFLQQLLKERLTPDALKLLSDTDKLDGLSASQLTLKSSAAARIPDPLVLTELAATPADDVAALAADQPEAGEYFKATWLASVVLKWVDAKRMTLESVLRTYKAVLTS